MPSLVCSIQRAGVFPSSTISAGFISIICVCRCLSQSTVSAGVGTRFSGGLHFTMLVM